jgi:hypothetical protein
MTVPRTPTEVLKDARRRDSHQKRARVFAAADEIKHTETLITFALIARAAQVSTWLVYADGVREYIEAARDYQAAQPHRQQLAGTRASEANLRTDLELARQDNRTLRAEIARLTHALREQLGQQLATTPPTSALESRNYSKPTGNSTTPTPTPNSLTTTIGFKVNSPRHKTTSSPSEPACGR